MFFILSLLGKALLKSAFHLVYLRIDVIEDLTLLSVASMSNIRQQWWLD